MLRLVLQVYCIVSMLVLLVAVVDPETLKRALRVCVCVRRRA